jgi:ElaA protein
MKINWITSPFHQLLPAHLYAILRVRQNVFMIEQNCMFQDMDGKDLASFHLFAWDEDSDSLLAYCRILPAGVIYEEASIGRIVTPTEARKLGLGRELVERGLTFMDTKFPGVPIKIQAQEYLLKFYQSFGFSSVSERYLDTGIWHVDMIRKI